MFKHSAILRTGALLIGAPIVFELAALGLLLRAQTETADAERWELHSKDVISRTAQLRMMLTRAHAAVRGAYVYRTMEFEKDRREALSRWPAMLADLRRFVADNPGQQAQIDRIGRAADPYFAYFTEMTRLGASGQWEAYRGELLTARGKTLADNVETALSRFVQEEGHLDGQRLAAVAASRLYERNVLLLIAGLAIVLAVALLVVFTRGFSQRLARIAVNGRRLATGDALLDPLPGDDELAALDGVLHDSARRLAAAAAAEKRYAAELEQRGRALEQANKDLLFRRQENETFVYSVSHDLRSPLVNVQGFTKELTQACEDLRGAIADTQVDASGRDRLARIVDHDIGEAVSFIQTAVTRLSSIVDALLRLSRAGRVEFSAGRARADRGTDHAGHAGDDRAAGRARDQRPAAGGAGRRRVDRTGVREPDRQRAQLPGSRQARAGGDRLGPAVRRGVLRGDRLRPRQRSWHPAAIPVEAVRALRTAARRRREGRRHRPRAGQAHRGPPWRPHLGGIDRARRHDVFRGAAARHRRAARAGGRFDVGRDVD
jgi:CHASE3 domain sensor protein